MSQIEKQNSLLKVVNLIGAWLLTIGLLSFLNFIAYKIMYPTFNDVGIDYKNLQALFLTLILLVDFAIIFGALTFIGIKAWKYFKQMQDKTKPI